MSFEFPKPAPWEQRRRSVVPLPGGYDGYLHSLRKICEMVDELPPTIAQLAELIEERFDQVKSLGAAQQRTGFLRTAGIITVKEDRCIVSNRTQKWLETDNADILIAGMHGRLRFIGRCSPNL